MTHTLTTHDGRRIRYNDETKLAMAYIRREGVWARTSMKLIVNRILLKELLAKIANPNPKLEGLVRQIRKETDHDHL